MFIHSYARAIFKVQNSEFQYCFGFFWSIKILWIFLGVITKLDFI